MKTIQDVESRAIELLSTTWSIKLSNRTEEVNILDLGYIFEFNKAINRSLGTCNYKYKTIKLSYNFTKDNVGIKNDLIDDVIRHEIAHAVSYHLFKDKGVGHGKYWKYVAKQVGATPKATQCDTGIVDNRKSKWTLRCNTNGCINVIKYSRKPTRNKACLDCCNTHNNGKYSDKYKLELIQNY